MLTGRTETPPGFDSGRPKPTDWPSIASLVTGVVPRRNNLPPAVVLPEKLIHVSGRTPKVFTTNGAKSGLPGRDHLGRPHRVYHGDPIRGLTGNS